MLQALGLTASSLEVVQQVKEGHGSDAGRGLGLGPLQSCDGSALRRVQVDQSLHQQHTNYVVMGTRVDRHTRVAAVQDL